MNCKNLILTAFKDSKSEHIQKYFDQALNSFKEANPKGQNDCRVVAWNQFTNAVLSEQGKDLGVCFGSSGVQQSFTLNQTKNIRAALTHNSYIARMCRQHNDANVIIISIDCIGDKLAGSLISEYLVSGFDGQEKNKLRIDKMMGFETKA